MHFCMEIFFAYFTLWCWAVYDLSKHPVSSAKYILKGFCTFLFAKAFALLEALCVQNCVVGLQHAL